MFSQEVLIPVNQGFFEVLFELNIALIAILFVIIVHNGVVFFGELELLEVLLDDFLVLLCELLEPLGVVDFEDKEAFDHLS